MTSRRAGTCTALALAVALAPGCGYRLAGANTFLPANIKVIAVPAFENRTTRPEIEQRVTEEVARELSKRGRYRVGADPATSDAVLEGAVTSYRTTPVSFTTTGRATRVEAVVTLQATLRETATDAVLWSQTGLLFKEQFDVPDTGDFVDQETVALDDIARGAASALVTSILEGF